jgi:hypothetical protein
MTGFFYWTYPVNKSLNFLKTCPFFYYIAY